MPELRLAGCTPEPLMGYLKALGLFRLVVEQADPQAHAWWDGNAFVLNSKFDRDGLFGFLLSAYCPTPILAPWNGGSGFYGGGAEPLELITNSTSDRLQQYRDAITQIRTFLPTTKPKDEEKSRLLMRCRAELSDEVVPWLDTCFVLTETGAGYFPLLGTGGNDGRLDFTNNFMQRLGDVIAFGKNESPPDRTGAFLSSSLFADNVVRLEKVSIGQFNPGGIGGPNGIQGKFEADSRVNPWDFVLMIEGAILFAGAAARRLDARVDRATFPFTVDSVAVGYGSAAATEETTDGSRRELWLPLWNQATRLPELRQLFAEGRAQFGRRQASNAIEFALAVCQLGVARGIDSFARYGFLKRNGLAFLATPLGRVRVQERQHARLLDDPALVGWLDSLRRACRDKDKTPSRYQAALRAIDGALFDFATRAQSDDNQADCDALRKVLVMVGRAERTLALGQRFCADNHILPIQGLNPDWLLIADDSPTWREFRLAAALASVLGSKKYELGPLRAHLEEVEQVGRVKWSYGSTSAVWSNRPFADNLCEIFLRRWLESERGGADGLFLTSRLFAPLGDVVAFLNQETTNDELLADLLWALIGVNWQSNEWFSVSVNQQKLKERFRGPVTHLPRDFALLRLLTQPVGLDLVRHENTMRWGVVRTNPREKAKQMAKKKPKITTSPIVAPFQFLARSSAGGDEPLDRAIDSAAHRLWSSGLVPFGWVNRRRRQYQYPAGGKVDFRRLVAMCLFPLARNTLARLANRALVVPDNPA